MLWVPTRQAALPGFHALVDADITGHTQGKRTHPGKTKIYTLQYVPENPVDVISTLGGLRVGAYPSDQVLCGYDQLL